MKARNKIIGLGVTMAALAVSTQTSAQINTGPNNTITGTYSSIAGGDWSGVSGNYSTVAGGASNSVTAPWSFIGGGRNNTALPSGFGTGFSTIGGGQSNSVSNAGATIAGGQVNVASGQQATVGGGVNNFATGFQSTIAGGSGNDATELLSTVGGGGANTASGSDSTVAGGLANTASGSISTVSGGSHNLASASRGTVPGGSRAHASHYGQFAFASGSFTTNNGEAQASMYVLRTSTTNTTTQTEMFLDGISERITIASGRTLVFEIQVSARSSANTSAAYLIKGAIDNNSGTTSFLNAPIVEVLGEDDNAWDATVQADNTNDALVLKVTGTASATIRWVATVRTTEVGH
jgi:hypothetical protein